MRLLDAAFDVLRKAGEPLSPAEIVRQIKSARIQIDANEPLDDASVKVELEHSPRMELKRQALYRLLPADSRCHRC